MTSSSSSSARRASLGLLLSVIVVLASMSTMGCAPEEEVDLSCEVTPGSATETRDLELGRFMSIDRVSTFAPLVEGEEVYRDYGDQGGSHLTVLVRFPALPEEGLEDRCMLISYERQGEVGEDGEENFREFVVQRRFRRTGDYWESGVIDTGAGFGPLDVLVRVEDNMVMGSGEVGLVLVER